MSTTLLLKTKIGRRFNMKTCTKCGEEKQATPEYFNRDKNKKDGLHSWCKDCVGEDRKQRKAKYKEKIFIYDDKTMKTCDKCKIENPATPEYFNRDIKMKDGLFNTCKECTKKKRRNHYQENKEHYIEYSKKYYQENKDRYREQAREYYQENKEHYAEYYQENKEWYREYYIIYHLENPEVNRLKNQRRRARMSELPHTLTVEEWEDSLEYFDYSCAYCGVPEDNLQQEHIIPVIKGGGYTADNIIPACGSCNASKHATDLEDWYVSYEHYDEERLNKILDYIEVVKDVTQTE